MLIKFHQTKYSFKYTSSLDSGTYRIHVYPYISSTFIQVHCQVVQENQGLKWF